MYGRNPGEALERYRELLARVFSCCWPHAYLAADRKAAEQDPEKIHALLLNRGAQIPLRGGRVALRFAERFSFDQQQEVSADQRWHLSIRGYLFALEIAGPSEEEILVWHWDPDALAKPPRKPAPFPHLHIGTRELTPAHLERKHHIPTGHVAIEDVLWFAFEELGVIPIRGDWQTVLAESRAETLHGRTEL